MPPRRPTPPTSPPAPWNIVRSSTAADRSPLKVAHAHPRSRLRPICPNSSGWLEDELDSLEPDREILVQQRLKLENVFAVEAQQLSSQVGRECRR